MIENQTSINKVVNNLGVEKYLLCHLKGTMKDISFKEEQEIFKEIMNNESIISSIKDNIHVERNILSNMETANRLEKEGRESLSDKMKNDVIQVGEYKIDKLDIRI